MRLVLYRTEISEARTAVDDGSGLCRGLLRLSHSAAAPPVLLLIDDGLASLSEHSLECLQPLLPLLVAVALCAECEVLADQHEALLAGGLLLGLGAAQSGRVAAEEDVADIVEWQLLTLYSLLVLLALLLVELLILQVLGYWAPPQRSQPPLALWQIPVHQLP